MITPDAALARLEAMCARAEHCTGEMRQKLRTWKIAGSDADKIIASLRERRFVDDSRFARAYVRDKLRFACWGRRKIAQGLALKRVDASIASEALASIPDEEYREVLQSVLASRLRLDPELLATFEGRQKLMRFAMQRGFEPQLASAALKSLKQSEDGE